MKLYRQWQSTGLLHRQKKYIHFTGRLLEPIWCALNLKRRSQRDKYSWKSMRIGRRNNNRRSEYWLLKMLIHSIVKCDKGACLVLIRYFIIIYNPTLCQHMLKFGYYCFDYRHCVKSELFNFLHHILRDTEATRDWIISEILFIWLD